MEDAMRNIIDDGSQYFAYEHQEGNAPEQQLIVQ